MSSSSSDSEFEQEPPSKTPGDRKGEGDSKLLVKQPSVWAAGQHRRSKSIYLTVVIGVLAALLIGFAIVAVTVLLSRNGDSSQDSFERALALLSDYPLIDG